MDNLHDNEELKDAPNLRSIPKVDPFVVPADFFDRFPHMVQTRIAEQEKRSVSGWIGRLSMSLRIGVATTSLACIGVLAFFALRPNDAPTVAQRTELTVDPIEIEVDDLSDPEILAMLPDEGPVIDHPATSELSDEELSAYVEQEELPLDLLIEEL